MRTTSLVHHRVADYDAWKTVYDSVADLQREGGVREHAVLRDPADPNMVVVMHTFDSAEAARAFFDQPGLRDAMGRGGVDPDSVRIEILDEVAAGTL